MSSSPDFLKQVSNKNGITELTSRELAKKLDETDKLNHLRQNFHIPLMGTLPEGIFEIKFVNVLHFS